MAAASFEKPGRENWVQDSDVTECNGCSAGFGMMTWKHHCRACGNIYCHKCCNKEITYTPYTRIQEDGYTQKKKKVCDGCYKHIIKARLQGAKHKAGGARGRCTNSGASNVGSTFSVPNSDYYRTGRDQFCHGNDTPDQSFLGSMLSSASFMEQGPSGGTDQSFLRLMSSGSQKEKAYGIWARQLQALNGKDSFCSETGESAAQEDQSIGLWMQQLQALNGSFAGSCAGGSFKGPFYEAQTEAEDWDPEAEFVSEGGTDLDTDSVYTQDISVPESRPPSSRGGSKATAHKGRRSQDVETVYKSRKSQDVETVHNVRKNQELDSISESRVAIEADLLDKQFNIANYVHGELERQTPHWDEDEQQALLTYYWYKLQAQHAALEAHLFAATKKEALKKIKLAKHKVMLHDCFRHNIADGQAEDSSMQSSKQVEKASNINRGSVMNLSMKVLNLSMLAQNKKKWESGSCSFSSQPVSCSQST
eukprot:CAMPEP_0179257752 /NCGR_PEP_ID=MMETSP0797-20121207/24954_1 /TAXON_ID=47934 /ORGANISM="Dinophysis acuminata, Strain DAEP01" /LENGTH=477 /DNA_ID=CAMNT_0020965747 /DNA_START=22 /DNA_END=1452 /DNA_ORIENTATION=+